MNDKEVKDLAGYRAVIAGSAIRMGAWLPEAVQFVEKNKIVLSNLPTSFFVVSGFLKDNKPETISKVNAIWIRCGRLWSQPKLVCLPERWITAN